MKKKERANNFIAKISALLGYLLAMVLCVFFALYMSAPAGWTFFYVLAAAPLFSLILLAVTYFTDCLEITASADSSAVYKNSEFFYKIKIKNKSILPVPAIIIKMITCEGITCEYGDVPLSVSVYTKGTTEFKISLKAWMWGSAEVGIKEIRISDFLNIISIPIYKNNAENFTSSIKVFPDIPDVPSDSPLIKSAAETIRFSDECEDTKETDNANIFSGMPGYTHREYTEGDPIKRINWKLSSKRNIFMIRLDDETEAMQQVIVLDSKSGSRKENERAVEGVLSIAFSLSRLGFDCAVFFNTKHGFMCSEISEYGDITVLQALLAEYSFSEAPGIRIPIDDLTAKNLSGIMLCTPCADTSLSAEISSASEYGITTTLVSASSATLSETPYWQLNSDYTAEFIS